MKVKKIGIKWKIFIYMLSFIGVLLALLWVLQTVYLEDFYKHIKTEEVEDAFGDIESVLESEDMTKAVEFIGSNYNICILVTDEKGMLMYSSEQDNQCYIHKLRIEEIQMYISMAERNDGIYSETKEKADEQFMQQNNGNIGDNYRDKFDDFVPDRFHNMREMTTSESIIKIKLYERSDGENIAVIVNSVITPVEATVKTLRVQLIYISVIVIVLALVLALLISWRISKPIIKINESAKILGKGDYNVIFEGDGYKEISQLSDTLNQATVELAKTENLQRELIANVSHDLRTPLTMITAYAEVMRDLPGENTPENVQVVIDEAKRLTNLVNDMLDISKMQAGVASANMTEYNLTAGIRSVVDRYSKLVEQDGYKVVFNYSDEDVMVKADEFKIYQVIYNLMNNAVNYTGPDKSVTVNQIVHGDIVRIEVVDTGEGITDDELDNVWERYYKIDKQHKRALMGTGLGLSIVKNILKLHNAKFGVNSKLGEGTVFWFELKK